MAAYRARIVLNKPGDDAVGMVQVLAWHLPRLCSKLELVFANWALWIVIEMPAVYLHHRHGVNSRLWSRSWALTVILEE
jgi:hypothetical protein